MRQPNNNAYPLPIARFPAFLRRRDTQANETGSTAETTRLLALTLLFFLSLSALTFGENVVLKNGIVYRGSIRWTTSSSSSTTASNAWSCADSKIARKDPDTTFGHWEVFKLEQPLLLHGGSCPRSLRHQSTPLEREGAVRPIRVSTGQVEQAHSMEQAIYELGPYKGGGNFGVDGFWAGWPP